MDAIIKQFFDKKVGDFLKVDEGNLRVDAATGQFHLKKAGGSGNESVCADEQMSGDGDDDGDGAEYLVRVGSNSRVVGGYCDRCTTIKQKERPNVFSR